MDQSAYKRTMQMSELAGPCFRVEVRTHEAVRYLTESTHASDPDRARELVGLAEGILQSLQALGESMTLPVYDAVAADVEKGQSTYSGTPTPLSRLVEFTDGRVVGRMMAGVWERDYQRRVEDLTILRKKWIDLRDRLTGELISPSDSLTQTMDLAEEEATTWNDAVLAQDHSCYLSKDEESAATEYTIILESSKATRRIAAVFPDGDVEATVELIDSHIRRVERSLRALEFPNTLTGDNSQDTALASAPFSWPYSRRRIALNGLVQAVIQGSEADSKISAIWSAYEAARDLRTPNPSFWEFSHSQTQELPWPLRSVGTSLRDLSLQENSQEEPCRPLSMENQTSLVQTLTENPTGSSVFTLASPDQTSRESAVRFLTVQGGTMGWKMINVDPTALPRDPAKALANIEEIVRLARRMGRTGLVIELDVLLAWQCEGTGPFLNTLLSYFKGGDVPLYFLAGPSAENELAFLQSDSGNKFFDAVAKRILLDPPEDLLPSLRARAETILSRADVFFPEGTTDNLLNGLLCTLSARRLSGDRDVLAWATKVLQRASADVITAVLAEKREDHSVQQEDLDRAVEALLPLPSPRLEERMRTLLDKSLAVMAPFRAECEEKLNRVSNARRSASSFKDANIEKDSTYLDNILRAFDKAPNPVPEGLAALEGLPPEEIEKQGKIVIGDILRNLSKALNASHQGLWRPKETIETAVGVFLTQILENMKMGTSAQEATSQGMFLLLSGPAGVGKTTLAAALAAALGLPFVPIACAGLHDVKVISGFGETYANSQPGIIVQAFQQSKNLRFLLYADEVDKADPDQPQNGGRVQRELAKAFRGSFEDTYLKGTVDTSGLIIVAGINFRDRTSSEVLECPGAKDIEIPGYTDEEKILMAGILFEKARRLLGLPEGMITVEAPQRIIAELVDYFPVPGVRELAMAAVQLTKWRLHEMIVAGESSAVVSVEDVRRVLGIRRESAMVGTTAERGVARILRLTENGAGLLEIQTVFTPQKGLGALQPVIRDVDGEWALDGVNLAIQVGLLKARQVGATTDDLEGRLSIGMPESYGLPDTKATSGPATVSVTSALRLMDVEPDAVVVGAFTKNEQLLPVASGALPDMLLKAAKSGVRTLFLAPSPSADGSFQEASLGLQAAFRVNPSLVGPVEWEGRALLSLPREPIPDVARTYYVDRARWNDFIAWVGRISALASGVSVSESRTPIETTPQTDTDLGAAPYVHLSGNREALRSWMDALAVLAISVGESLKIPRKDQQDRLTLCCPEGTAPVEWEGIMNAVMANPPAGSMIFQQEDHRVVRGNLEELRAWYWNLRRLSRVPFYVLAAHLDQVTDQLLRHPSVLRMGSISDEGVLSLSEIDPTAFERIARRARLLGARNFVMPAGALPLLTAVLKRVPLLNGPIIVRRGAMRSAFFPCRLAKASFRFHPPRPEVERWRVFIKSLGDAKRVSPDEIGRWNDDPSGEWMHLTGTPERIDAVLGKMPSVTESMCFVLAEKRRDLTIPEIEAFRARETAVTPASASRPGSIAPLDAEPR